MFEVKESCDYQEIEKLFREYSLIKGAEACFVSFETELKNLAKAYEGGVLVIAYENGVPVGCGALKKISSEISEMKRIYIKESYRGKGYGRRMVEYLLKIAGQYGFEKIQLSTVPEVMCTAFQMYRQMGFAAYDEKNDIAYMELNLRNLPE